MALSAIEIKHLNNMNRAAKDVLLGDIINIADLADLNAIQRGTHVVTTIEAGSATAKATVVTGLNVVSGWLSEIYRSGSSLGAGHNITTGSGNLYLQSGNSGSQAYVLTDADVWNWLAY